VFAGVWAGVTYAQSGVSRPDFSDEGRLREFLVAKAEKTVYPDRCAECHKSEFEVWENTVHATQFSELHTRESAKAIYARLGLRLIRRVTDERTPACLQCHYTPRIERGDLRASIGVSCESCHGPASEWMGVHNDYGVQEPDFQKAAQLETPEHRQQRIADSRAKGQRRPSDIYEVGANCFQCHTVPNEELVNVGGHSAGSTFDLVARIEDIRHNFLQSFLTGDGKTNAPTSAERKRILTVVSRALDLEYSLRGIAAATKEDLYLSAMIGRQDAAVGSLLDVEDALPIPEVARMLAIVDSVGLKANNRDELTAAADAVGATTRAFIERADGAALAGLDPLWDPSAEPVDRPSPPPAAASPGAAPPAGGGADPPGSAAGGQTTAVAAPPVAAPPVAASGSTSTGAATTPPPPAPPPPAGGGGGAPGAARGAAARAPAVQGEMLRRPPWRPEPAHAFAPVPCTTCHRHRAQIDWLKQDPHSGAAAKFRNGGQARQQQIATAYGLSAEEMVKGNQICMTCHGTATGNARATVRNGVDCQQCHGPAADYRESHQDGNYADAIRPERGMVNLKDPMVRARTCAGCHYITDARLLSAGHTSGADFKLDERVGRIRHWGPAVDGKAVDIAAPALRSAHEAVIQERGPVPTVQAVSQPPAPAAPPPAPASPPSGGSTATTGGATGASTGAPGAPPPPAGGGGTATPTPAATPPAAGAGAPPPDPTAGGQMTPPGGEAGPTPAAATAPAAPPAQPTDSVDEVLLQLKRRLEQLYERLRGAGSR
jgi:hypothetical protein